MKVQLNPPKILAKLTVFFAGEKVAKLTVGSTETRSCAQLKKTCIQVGDGFLLRGPLLLHSTLAKKTSAEGGLACLPSPAGRLPGAQIARNDRDWEVNNLEEKSEKRMRE